MDIDILLFLQEFRNGAGAILVDFLNKMTFFGEINTVLVLMAVLYWAISKEFGTYILMGWSGNRIANGFLKVTVCAYRPWVRDPRIIPYGNSMTTATGYSFPSGHTMNGASVFGGSALRKELPKGLRIVFGLVVVLIAFSRIYLGVHTPQDILVGGIVGVLVMWLTIKLMNWISTHPEKEMWVVGIGVGLAVAVAIYAATKSYPMDYDANGNLLVDGMKMANDTFKAVGWCAAFLVGWILEKKYVSFSTDVSMLTRVTRITFGLLGYYVVSLILMTAINGWIAGPAGTVITSFVQMFYIAFIFPWCMKYFEKENQ